MKKARKYIGTLALGTVALAVASCSDSWDEHYAVSEQTSSAAGTLWEKIQSNPKLTKFASIAEKAPYFKDEAHKQINPQTGAPYTFKEMLSSTQLLTVWAPEDEFISNEDYNKWMELLETYPYTVQQQLMGNSIALWRNVATTNGVDSLRMLNGKITIFDKTNLTMGDQHISQSNIAASNGTLHTLSGNLPFDFNLYEYLKDKSNTDAKSLTRFHNYIINTDTTYFQENGSIEGKPDTYGNPTYVDSAYITTNAMFFGTKRLTNSYSDRNLTYMESFGANIESEDSAFIMLMPTDQAWEGAYEKIKGLYKYANIYVDNEKGNDNTEAYREIPAEQMDSVTEQSINMDIISPLVYNLHKQPNATGQAGRWEMEDFIATNGENAKYILNTFGDTLRNDESWSTTSLFEGEKVKMSNGYGIVSNSWNIPRKLYKPDVIIEVGWQSLYNADQASGSALAQSFSNEVAATWVEETGKVSKNNFYYFKRPSASKAPEFEFKLIGTDGENHESEVMSGKYDIYVVMVPDYYMISKDSIIYSENVAYMPKDKKTGLYTDTIPFKHKMQATISFCNNDVKGKDATVKSEVMEYEGLKVDTLLMFKDFEFPYSYKNLRYSYPTMSIKSSSGKSTEGYTLDFCIDKIILVAKDDE